MGCRGRRNRYARWCAVRIGILETTLLADVAGRADYSNRCCRNDAATQSFHARHQSAAIPVDAVPELLRVHNGADGQSFGRTAADISAPRIWTGARHLGHAKPVDVPAWCSVRDCRSNRIPAALHRWTLSRRHRHRDVGGWVVDWRVDRDTGMATVRRRRACDLQPSRGRQLEGAPAGYAGARPTAMTTTSVAPAAAAAFSRLRAWPTLDSP